MAVDKNLFMYNLAVVAIMKNEGPYVKEWLDYHLLAGADHFYIYDNESPDNLKEVVKPYVDAGLVTYTFYPGKCRQMEAYNDAIKRFKFSCRYMAIIDGDEFLFPQNNRSIPEVIDEIAANNPNASGFVFNWQVFGSSYHNTADYSRGVLQRFTHCSAKLSETVKSVYNPRKVAVFHQPHSAQYYEGCFAVNENGVAVPAYINNPPTSAKMKINHYSTKSREEYENKVRRGMADHFNSFYSMEGFTHDNVNNRGYDDSILDYVKARRDALLQQGGGVLQTLAPIKAVNYQGLFGALTQNLALTFDKNVSTENLRGRMETFLTCLSLSTYLKDNFFDEDYGNFFEEASLKAVKKTISSNVFVISDIRLLLSEIPNIITMPYPVVNDIRLACIDIITILMGFFRVNNVWREFSELDYLQRLLKGV